jgi:hypothetical protein
MEGCGQRAGDLAQSWALLGLWRESSSSRHLKFQGEPTGEDKDVTVGAV